MSSLLPYSLDHYTSASFAKLLLQCQLLVLISLLLVLEVLLVSEAMAHILAIDD